MAVAGSEQIVVVYAYLDTLEANARHSADALQESSHMMNLDFTGNSEVRNAYDDFLGKWDKHRGDLHTGVTAAADAFRAVHDAFQAAETELIAALE